jgi:outer membrane protein OmpA-like peptidoglycan-associated protein
MSRKHLLTATLLASPFWLAATAGAQPVTGLYVGAGAGANFMEQQQVRFETFTAAGTPVLLTGRSGFEPGWVGAASVGWGFGNGVRVELEGNYRNNRVGTRDNAVFSFEPRAHEEKYGAMVNALFDLDVGSRYVYPYVGAGIGYSHLTHSNVGLAGLGNEDSNAFAYQAIAGLSFPVPWVVGLSVTAEYRYFAVEGDRTFTANPRGIPAQLRLRGDFNHDLMLGVRYAFNVAPPPPPAAVVTPPPAVEAARTYLVFFDWDRADLTDRARQIIGEAAQATTRVQVTRIEVNGYTDLSGTARYNMGLSIRRAQNVANELVRDGVPRQAISIQGFGKTHPLVPTADGVREPQNRRVEIILH